MAGTNLESFDEIMKTKGTQIEKEFDLILLFTCWYLNYKGYKIANKDDDQLK